MATKKSMFVLFGILVISSWVLGSAIQVGAETLNYKAYTYVAKAESVPVGDVEGHTLGLNTRRAFLVFENGEVATQRSVITTDWIKGSGSALQYSTITFSDGSTIIIKSQNIRTEAAPGARTTAEMTREIIKGTGRFEGIKGTGIATNKFLPLEEGEAGQKGIGEGSITYTLPSK
jgi:hypothetical protein